MAFEQPSVVPAWGTTNQTSADMVQPPTSEIETGWPLTTTPPSRQYFNWFFFFVSNAVRYYATRGLTDYNPAETYGVGARCIGDDNNTYASIINNNTGNTPSATPTAWQPWGLSVAQIDAAQLTQATPSSGDASNKVANTSFVTAALNTLSNTLQNAITAVQNNLNAFENSNAIPATQGSNGNYYRLYPDGTLECWGVSAATGGGGNSAQTAVTFARGFSQAVQSLTLTGPSGSNGNPMSVSYGSVTLQGCTAQFYCSVPTGGGGGSVPSGAVAYYYAVGK